MEREETKQINPWVSIWTQPRKTMRSILETNPKKKIILLSILNGVASGLVWLATLWSKSAKADFRKSYFILALLILGAIFGVIGLYLGGWLYKIFGRLLKGKGSFTEVKSAVGWSAYPFLIVSILNFLSLLTLLRTPILSFIISLIALVFTVWAFVISLKLIAEAHQFSAWRALGTVFVTVVFIFIVFLILGLLIPVLNPLFAIC